MADEKSGTTCRQTKEYLHIICLTNAAALESRGKEVVSMNKSFLLHVNQIVEHKSSEMTKFNQHCLQIAKLQRSVVCV